MFPYFHNGDANFLLSSILRNQRSKLWGSVIGSFPLGRFLGELEPFLPFFHNDSSYTYY